MNASIPDRIQRQSYTPPSFFLDQITLDFQLDLQITEVHATLVLRANPDHPAQLVRLDGEHLTLLSLSVNGQTLDANHYTLTPNALSFRAPDANTFTVCIHNRLHPSENSSLMGLYASRGALFTQCEAEGMRRITWLPDRPDVLATYRVRLEADRETFPVLLSNGNLIEQGSGPGNRHHAVWEDPFPKPSYLFAIVAADLVCRETTVQTMSGRNALLQVWGEPRDLPRLDFALQSLKRAVSWDEKRFGRELDLDRYMVVATADFNMGAMENKGLNIFNARYVLADQDIATDTDFANIESIIGHEYFHNWSGNRVTCRDWFQLSLKEGLTVFRDQEFTADLLADEARSAGADPELARAIARIDDVRALRTVQFPEDSGPMAHPVRPDSYLEISNFYTPTVYEKGAEVVRMLQTLLGREIFRQGLDLYFSRHDGTAATCEDLVQAMADTAGRPLDGFMGWYEQSGTPRVRVYRNYDARVGVLEFRFDQTTPPTPGQPEKHILPMPISLGLLDSTGQSLPLQLEGETNPGASTRVLELTHANQGFRFMNVPPGTVPSILRHFSAPAYLDIALAPEELDILARHDPDGFNRWEACNRIALANLLDLTDDFVNGRVPRSPQTLVRLFAHTLDDARAPAAFKERILQLPAEAIVAEHVKLIDPRAIRAARQHLRQHLGQVLASQWQTAYHQLQPQGAYTPQAEDASRRSLRNLALSYLAAVNDHGLDLARQQLRDADNLTDRLAALTAIVHGAAPDKADILLQTARRWQGQALLMNKWLAVQASAPGMPGEPRTLERVRMLLRHPAYSSRNPNNVYALVLGFCQGNLAEFHQDDGQGYDFWAEQVLAIDAVNPIVAARIARTLERWRRFPDSLAKQMQAALQRVEAHPSLSKDVREIIERALGKN